MVAWQWIETIFCERDCHITVGEGLVYKKPTAASPSIDVKMGKYSLGLKDIACLLGLLRPRPTANGQALWINLLSLGAKNFALPLAYFAVSDATHICEFVV